MYLTFYDLCTQAMALVSACQRMPKMYEGEQDKLSEVLVTVITETLRSMAQSLNTFPLR